MAVLGSNSSYVRDRFSSTLDRALLLDWRRLLPQVLFCLMLVVCCVLALILILQAPETSKDEFGIDSTPSFCNSNACMNTGLSIMTNLNEAVDPCDDFYKFTCGGMMDGIADDEMSLGSFEDLQTRVNVDVRQTIDEISMNYYSSYKSTYEAFSFYRDCVRRIYQTDDKLEAIKKELQKLGGWPLTQLVMSDRSNWTTKTINSIQAFGDVGLISVAVGRNGFNASKKIIMIKNTPLDVSENLLKNGLLDVVLKAFPSNFRHIHESKLKELYTLLKKIHPKPLVEAMYEIENYMPIKKLQEEIPSVDWLTFLTLTATGQTRILQLTDNEIIFIKDLHFLKSVVAYLNNKTIDESTLSNLIGWQIAILIFEPYLDVIQKQSVYSKNVKRVDAEERCMPLATYYFNYVFTHVYGRSKTKKTDARPLEEIIDHMIYSYREQAIASDWLDERAVKAIQIKLEEMSFVLNISTWANDTEQLNSYYYSILGGRSWRDSYYDIFLSTRKKFHQFQFDNLRTPINEKDIYFGISSTSTLPFYALDSNSLVIPIGFQGLPFYDADRPRYLNFGSAGFVIGHEMSHAFDATAFKLDGKGQIGKEEFNMNQTYWRSYRDKVECVKEQYSANQASQDDDIEGFELSSIIEESIADTQALKNAFEGYKHWKNGKETEDSLIGLQHYSHEQMFFISYGSSWCQKDPQSSQKDITKRYGYSSNYHRVNFAVANSDQFSEVFSCPKNSRMNPINKCSIW